MTTPRMLCATKYSATAPSGKLGATALYRDKLRPILLADSGLTEQDAAGDPEGLPARFRTDDRLGLRGSPPMWISGTSRPGPTTIGCPRKGMPSSASCAG